MVWLAPGHTRQQCQLNTCWVSSWGNSRAHDLESVALKTIGVIVESTDIFVRLCNACLCGSGVSMFYFQPVNTEVWQARSTAPSANGAASATPWRLQGAGAQLKPAEKALKPRGGPDPGCHKAHCLLALGFSAPSRAYRRELLVWSSGLGQAGVQAAFTPDVDILDTHSWCGNSGSSLTAFKRVPKSHLGKLQLHTQLHSPGGLQF